MLCAPRRLLAPLLFLLAACSKPGDPIDPATATSRDLEGWWLHRSDAGSQHSILGLLSETEARRQLPVEENGIVIPPPEGLSTSYESGGWGEVLYTNYVATWSVSGGQLVENVLADRDGPLDATWSTAIRALTPRQSLTLQSSQDPSGERTWRWYERCPVFMDTGWHAYSVPIPGCAPSLAQGNSLAFDDEGHLHAAVGVLTGDRCVKPVYAYVTKGCEPRRYVLPDFGHSAIEVRGGVVRLALVTANAQVLVFEGPAGALTFQQTLVDNGPVPTNGLRFLPGAERPTLLLRADRVNDTPLLTTYTLEGSAWTKRTGAQVPFPFASSIAPGGDVVFVRDFAVHRVRPDGTPVGAPLALPRERPVPEPPVVTEDGRVQVVLEGRDLGDVLGGQGGRVVGRELVFAEWGGQRWREVSLGRGYEAFFVNGPGGVTRLVVSLEKASQPSWALYELRDGVIVATERITSAGAFAPGATPDFYTRPRAVVDAAGAIGFSAIGLDLSYRAPGGPPERRPASMTLALRGTGGGRVVSDDGRIDCRGECLVTGATGERILVRAIPDPGSALRMPCYDSAILGGDRCYLELLGTGDTFLVDTMQTPYERTLSIGNPGGSALSARASARGERVLLQANLTTGVTSFAIGATELSLAAPAQRALVGYDRASGTGWTTPLPEDALALQALPEGGGWVVLAVFGVVELGGRQLGAVNTRQVLRVRVDATGKVTDSALLAEGDSLFQFAAAVALDGSAVVAFRTPSAPQAQFARLDAAGASSQGSLGVDAPPQRAWVDGERALVTAGSTLVSLQGGTVAGSRTFSGVTLSAAALQGGRAVVGLTLSVEADFGGGVRPPGDYLAQYDAALALTAQAVLTAPAVAVAAFDDGAVGMLSNRITGGTWAARFDAALAARGALEPLDLKNVLIQNSSQDENSLVLLGLQTGAASLDGYRLTAQTPRTWLIEVAR
jgi:hypothetical protein